MTSDDHTTTAPSVQPPVSIEQLRKVMRDFEQEHGPPPESEIRLTRDEYEAIKNHPDVVVTESTIVDELTGVRISVIDEELPVFTKEQMEWLMDECRKMLYFKP